MASHGEHKCAPQYGSIAPSMYVKNPQSSMQVGRCFGEETEVAGLVRTRSTRSITFMASILSAVPFGLSTTLMYPMIGGGPVTIIWGWVFVSAVMLCVAVSLAEITSVFPVAGGVYHQTYMLAPSSCRAAMAWITGWAYVFGNITITLSVNFGNTLLLTACWDLYGTDAEPALYTSNKVLVYGIFFTITLAANAISIYGNKFLSTVDNASIIMTILGLTGIVYTITAQNEKPLHSMTYLLTEYHPVSGWPSNCAFLIGLLHAAYATSATGMVVSMCDEARKPSIQVPKAIVGAVILNFFCGLLILVPLTLILPDLDLLASYAPEQALPFILSFALKDSALVYAACAPIIALGFLCGLACTTAASRSTWAFARDGAIPGSITCGFKDIDAARNVPVNAMLLNMTIELVLGLLYFYSTEAFNAFAGAGVIFLTLSYVVPIALSLSSGRVLVKRARYHAAYFGKFCNVISIAWCLFAIPLFCMPARLPVSIQSMNYASAVFVGGVAFSALWYVAYGRRHFDGPEVDETKKVHSNSSSMTTPLLV